MVYELITSALDTVFSPLLIFQSHIAILIISVILTVAITLANRILVNRDLVREIKRRIELIKENLTQAQKEGNKEKLSKLSLLA